MSNSTTVVKADQVSKCYRVYEHPRHRLIQALWGRDRLGRKKQFYREFWALQNVSLELKQGQTLGLVGRNGSGKSTLLQLLCGTLQPTTGSIEVKGRIGALLELGSGFNPEFSGMENIYLNASLLGLSRSETDERLDDILGFADIGDFINQPVKTYSSGMVVRLAFAVQAHIDPDLLVVDEALAVGDELFQKKCYAHLERLKENGTSILLVTHSCPQIIQHCDEALLLHRGIPRMHGEPARVTSTYQRLINASDEAWDAEFAGSSQRQTASTEQPARRKQDPATDEIVSQNKEAYYDPLLIPQSTETYPSHGVQITDAKISLLDGTPANIIPAGTDFSVQVAYSADQSLNDLILVCSFANVTGQRISGQTYPLQPNSKKSTSAQSDRLCCKAGTSWGASFSFKGCFWPGVYFLVCGVLQETENGRSFIHRIIDFKTLRVLDQDGEQVIGSCNLTLKEPILISH